MSMFDCFCGFAQIHMGIFAIARNCSVLIKPIWVILVCSRCVDGWNTNGLGSMSGGEDNGKLIFVLLSLFSGECHTSLCFRNDAKEEIVSICLLAENSIWGLVGVVASPFYPLAVFKLGTNVQTMPFM